MKSLLVILALLATGCTKSMISVPDAALAGTVFHVTTPDDLPIMGLAVCHEDTCAITNAKGDASLDLPLEQPAFILFRPANHVPLGEVYTPNGAVIRVVLHL